MDGMKGKSRMRVKVISDLLDCGLFEFACKEGRVTSKEKEKFKHVTDFGCVQRSADLPDIFNRCWHMDHLVRMQNTLKKPKDIEKLGNEIKLTDFDYALEFSRIQYMFMKIINKEVVTESGLFYTGEHKLEDSGSPPKLLGQILV